MPSHKKLKVKHRAARDQHHPNASIRIHLAQLKDAVAIMATLIPALLDIMIDSGKQIWGDPAYPVVD